MVAKGAPKKAATASKPAPKGAKIVKKDIKKDDAGASREKCGVVDEDMVLDEDERHTGECVFFNRKSGFGFIKIDSKGLCQDDKVMVHWGELQSEDRWPYLTKGTKVELSLMKKKDGKDTFVLKAKEVSLPGGEKIALQEEVDAKKEFIGDKHMRFLGNVKFFDSMKGFGYVKIQEGYAIEDDIPNEFRVDREEVNSGDDLPRLNENMEIEFGIQKSTKGIYSCYNVTLPGGDEITRLFVEGRKEASGDTYTGTIHFYSISKRFGFITPDSVAELPTEVKKALEADHKKRTSKGKDSEANCLYFRAQDKADRTQRINKGDKVSFKAYTDKQGVGACEVLQL